MGWWGACAASESAPVPYPSPPSPSSSAAGDALPGGSVALLAGALTVTVAGILAAGVGVSPTAAVSLAVAVSAALGR